jgi:carboxymethylenebutenolidase
MRNHRTSREDLKVPDISNPVQNVAFASNGDQAFGYLALPASGSGPGLIVIQEWWGLTTHMAHVADRLAAEGYVALAPDLYGGATTHDEGEALQLLLELPVDRAARDLGGAVDYLLSRDEVVGETLGVVGFCMGGAFALQLAVQEEGKVAAVVAFYPTGYLPDGYSGLQAPVLIHIPDSDAINPPTLAQDLIEKISVGSGINPEIDHYPAGHAFLNEEDLLGTYDPEQARIAWDRTLTFLHAHLR